MALREVVLIGNDILRKKARRVRDFDAKLHTLLDDMLETMHKGAGIGLAAPQVGVSQRVIVIQMPDDEDEYGPHAGELFEAVNPSIIRASREMVEDIEGCLSIPGYVGNVNRHQAVTVRAQDRHGKAIRIKARDWLARVFQHEIDHLDGVLFIDLTDEVWEPGKEPPPDEAESDAVETTAEYPAS